MEDRKNVVLFVDDEPHILSSIRRATGDEAFEALFASSGKEALDIFEKRRISVIVTDMRMPGMDGLTLLKVIREQYPKTVRIVLSGYTQLSQVLATVNQADIFQFIPKPWSMEEELLVGVRQAIVRFNLEAERDSLREKLIQKNQAYQNVFRELQQKFSNEKRDLVNLKRVNHWTLAFLKKSLAFNSEYLVENKAVISQYVDLIEEIMSRYLEILPIVIEGKTVAQLSENLAKSCTGCIVTIQNNDQVDKKIFGYHLFFVMVFRSILQFFAPESKSEILCNIEWKTKQEKPLFVMKVSRPSDVQSSVLQKNRLKIGCSLLNEMGGIYKISVWPEVIQGEIESVQIQWQISNEEE
jgi:two-component system, NtrC family, response regulator HupR/HoxA